MREPDAQDVSLRNDPPRQTGMVPAHEEKAGSGLWIWRTELIPAGNHDIISQMGAWHAAHRAQFPFR